MSLVRQIVALLLFTAASFGRQAAEALDRVTLQLKWQHQFQFAGYYAAIAPDRIAQLFEPYVHADASVARRFGGTGLGLSISKRLAQFLGGGIGVQSAPESGSIFTVEIEAGVPEETP